MLRRPPTAIHLTHEDLHEYVDAKEQRTAGEQAANTEAARRAGNFPEGLHTAVSAAGDGRRDKTREERLGLQQHQ